MPDAPRPSNLGPNVPFPPMEAELVAELPSGGGWRYEPKWDGFRGVLEKVAAGTIQLSPVSDDVEQGRDWLQTLQAAGFDGVIAKRLGLPYLPGSRDGVVKVKPHKTADCVVAGIRWKKGGRDTIATLLLGLYGDEGELHYVGSAAVGAKNQAEIAAKVLPLLDEKSDRRFSEPNRWGTDGLEEAPLKPELVVEVRFDKLEKHRFRHGTRLLRFRPDKDPEQCTWREVRPPRRASDLAVEDLLR